MSETRHTDMFRPHTMYGEAYEGNGDPEGVDGFYFIVQGVDEEIGGRLAGYVSREQFNALAKLLGTPLLSVPCPDCKGRGGHEFATCNEGCCTNFERCEKCEGKGTVVPLTDEQQVQK